MVRQSVALSVDEVELGLVCVDTEWRGRAPGCCLESRGVDSRRGSGRGRAAGPDADAQREGSFSVRTGTGHCPPVLPKNEVAEAGFLWSENCVGPGPGGGRWGAEAGAAGPPELQCPDCEAVTAGSRPVSQLTARASPRSARRVLLELPLRVPPKTL